MKAKATVTPIGPKISAARRKKQLALSEKIRAINEANRKYWDSPEANRYAHALAAEQGRAAQFVGENRVLKESIAKKRTDFSNIQQVANRKSKAKEDARALKPFHEWLRKSSDAIRCMTPIMQIQRYERFLIEVHGAKMRDCRQVRRLKKMSAEALFLPEKSDPGEISRTLQPGPPKNSG